MADVLQDAINRMMVKCARRCCVCRRFRPTKLQVHHIDERQHGGSDDEDNLIVICLPCHTDVHSTVPFTRRFSHAELKGHRDALIQLVAEGRFPDESDNSDEIESRIVVEMFAGRVSDSQLSPAAVELLLAAAHAEGNRQGIVVVAESNAGVGIYPGNRERLFAQDDRRAAARYKAALRELEEQDLLEYTSDAMREVTHLGYIRADELLAEHGQVSE